MKNITVRLPEDLLNEIDIEAKNHKKKRSELIRNFIEYGLKNLSMEPKIDELLSAKKSNELLINEIIKSTQWQEVALNETVKILLNNDKNKIKEFVVNLKNNLKKLREKRAIKK
jgi:metal-responsive CopG/Arc/MetJ family transcriptional regulator